MGWPIRHQGSAIHRRGTLHATDCRNVPGVLLFVRILTQGLAWRAVNVNGRQGRMAYFGRLDSVTTAMCCTRRAPVRGMLGFVGTRLGPPGLGGLPLLFLTGSWVPPVLRDADCCVWKTVEALPWSAVLLGCWLLYEGLPESCVSSAAGAALGSGAAQAPGVRPPDLAFFFGDSHGPSWEPCARFGVSAAVAKPVSWHCVHVCVGNQWRDMLLTLKHLPWQAAFLTGIFSV